MYWRPENWYALKRTNSFGGLCGIALTILQRMPQPVGEVCGPISTGGQGSLEANLQVFSDTIDQLVAQKKVIFDQIPFEDHIFRIVNTGWGKRQNNQLLKEFYLPIFESGFVRTLYFIPDWQSSKGATWEHTQGQRLGMEIVYL